jgi:hypothetical protein
MVLTKAKETKGTVRYDFAGEGQVAVPSMYIKKTHVPSPHPDTVKVTVQFGT